MEGRAWLVISYNLPTEPSRHRVATWRALKKLGAVNLQQSMWVLPQGPENGAALESLSLEIDAAGGESLLMRSRFFRPDDEAKVVSLFNAMRDAEYAELVSECGKYLKEIEKEIAKEKFVYAELEEEEAELDKLAAWHERIAARDIFDAPGGSSARERLGAIRAAFESYGELVYAHESKDGPAHRSLA
jgi:DNA-binding transcriptional regulator PaaX